MKKSNEDICQIGLHYLKDNVICASSKMHEIFQLADRIAKTESSILITGESGVGKEILVNYIHQRSVRAGEPLISVNCSSIPTELMEAEIFGYEAGSFTGADRNGRKGLFESADRGTIFLDELGELPLLLQTKLLRVLDSGEIRRVGGTSSKKVNFRLIAATNRDLCAMVRENLFREDLYYRISVLPLEIPPLRERQEEILPLAKHFLEKYNRKYDYSNSFSLEQVRMLQTYSWPGNVRELRNFVERFVVTNKLPCLTVYYDNTESDKVQKNIHGNASLKQALASFEQEYIARVLSSCDGNVTKAARRLGVHRSSVYRKVKSIQRSAFLGTMK